MPIKVQGDLPAKEILERENIFVMDENRAMHQDIRPIQILIVNLMPLKEETELQLLRSLSNTPLQIDVTFLTMNSHESKNTSTSHLNKFYLHFKDVKENKYDGMIVTGAPVENMEFEEVDYWKEITEIMDWSETHVTSTIFLCWAAQASLYHFYGLKKRQLPQKMFLWYQVFYRYHVQLHLHTPAPFCLLYHTFIMMLGICQQTQVGMKCYGLTCTKAGRRDFVL